MVLILVNSVTEKTTRMSRMGTMRTMDFSLGQLSYFTKTPMNIQTVDEEEKRNNILQGLQTKRPAGDSGCTDA